MLVNNLYAYELAGIDAALAAAFARDSDSAAEIDQVEAAFA